MNTDMGTGSFESREASILGEGNGMPFSIREEEPIPVGFSEPPIIGSDENAEKNVSTQVLYEASEDEEEDRLLDTLLDDDYEMPDESATGSSDNERLRLAYEQRDQAIDRFNELKRDFDAYRKRLEAERARAKTDAIVSSVSSILPVLDDFERSISHYSNGTPEQRSFADANRSIRQTLLNGLMSMGVEEIDPLGQPFDANICQAMQQTDGSGYGSGIVSKVWRYGYKVGDRVIRPAQVEVEK